MPRKRWIQDPNTGELVPENEYIPRHKALDTSALIMPDIDAFVSTVDGTIIHSRSNLREHNKKHGVTNISDFKETWAKAAKDRAAYREGNFNSGNQREMIARALEKRS